MAKSAKDEAQRIDSRMASTRYARAEGGNTARSASRFAASVVDDQNVHRRIGIDSVRSTSISAAVLTERGCARPRPADERRIAATRSDAFTGLAT